MLTVNLRIAAIIGEPAAYRMRVEVIDQGAYGRTIGLTESTSEASPPAPLSWERQLEQYGGNASRMA